LQLILAEKCLDCRSERLALQVATVNLLGKEKRVKVGVKNKQFLAAMDNQYLARLLSLAEI
jgi:hypothetical protein